MGISERKERERQEMRQRIIDAATTMFIEEGYERTSIRNIAERIEYSPATIYLYYKDKDELLYEIQKSAFEKLGKAFFDNCKSEHAFERLVQIHETYFKFSEENPGLYDLMFIMQAPMNNIEEHELWENGHDSYEFLVKTVRDCVEQKLIKFDNADFGALSIWAMAHGLISLNLTCRMKVTNMSDEETRQVIKYAMMNYINTIKTV